MVITSGNPDNRTKKNQDTWIAKQITQPLDFKSKKYSTQEWAERTDYYRTPKYKEYEQRQERKHKHKMRVSTSYSENPEQKQEKKEYSQKYQKEHEEEYKQYHKKYYQEHKEAHKRCMKRLRQEYYDKGTTKKQENVKRHLEAKKKLGFSHIELEQVI